MELNLDTIEETAPQVATGSSNTAPTEKQVRFAKALQRGFLVAQGMYSELEDPEGLIDTLSDPAVTRKGISRLIDSLLQKGVQPIWDPIVPGQIGCSEKQHSFIKTLAADRGVDVEDAWLASKGTASEAITRLKAMPKVDQDNAPADAPEGMHRLDGEIYKVQIAHHGSGRPYAKRLVLSGAEGVFEYAGGVVGRLSEDTLMSLEEAKEYGALYGVCVRCGRTLTDEDSIAAGIGPICATRFA